MSTVGIVSDLKINLASFKQEGFDLSEDDPLRLLPDFPEEIYLTGKEIGQGATGRVFSVQNVQNPKKSLIAKEVLNSDQLDSILQEWEVGLAMYDHPLIPRVCGLFKRKFHPHSLVLIQEEVPGANLNTYLKNKKTGIPEPIARSIFKDVLSCLADLHKKQIVHCDLKPGNIVLDHLNGRAHLIDFGSSYGPFVDGKPIRTLVGTPAYMAPEFLLTTQSKRYDNKVDQWSLGVLLFHLLTGTPPFSVRLISILSPKHDRFELSTDQKTTLIQRSSEIALDLVLKLLSVNRNNRIDASTALVHPWVMDQTIERPLINEASSPPQNTQTAQEDSMMSLHSVLCEDPL